MHIMIMRLWTPIDLLWQIVISSEWSQTRTIRLFLDNFRFKKNIFVYKMKMCTCSFNEFSLPKIKQCPLFYEKILYGSNSFHIISSKLFFESILLTVRQVNRIGIFTCAFKKGLLLCPVPLSVAKTWPILTILSSFEFSFLISNCFVFWNLFEESSLSEG